MSTQPTHTAPMRLDHAEVTIRGAITRALHEHASLRATVHVTARNDDVTMTQTCTCGLITDGSQAERAQHLTDVTTAAVMTTLTEHAQAERTRAQHVARGDDLAAYRAPQDGA